MSDDIKPEDEPDHRAAAIEVASCARKLLPDIIRCLRESSIHDTSYAYTYRVKKPDRIIEKVIDRRGNEDSADYCVGNVTDVLGIRVVTLFFDELGPAARDVARMLTDADGRAGNHLKANKILEAKVYTTARSEYAMPVKQLENILEKELGESLRVSGNGVNVGIRGDYSSIHLVAMLSVEPETEDGITAVPVEIQIRTVFEDAWAQIDHKLRYARTRTKNTATRQNVSVASEQHLPVLKRFLDTCSDYAEVIREHLQSPEAKRGQQLVPIDGSEAFLEWAEKLQVTDNLKADFLRILQAKERLDMRFNENVDTGPDSFDPILSRTIQNEYAELAEDINRMYRENRRQNGYIEPQKLDNESNLFMYYSLRMEEAYCRTRSDRPDEKLEGLRIYRKMSLHMSDNAIVHLRFAQRASKHGDLKDAIKSFEEAEQIVERLKDLPEEERGWHLTDVQLRYIKDELHRLWGFAEWKLSDTPGLPPSECAEHLVNAINVTNRGYAHLAEGNHGYRITNNILYFQTELDSLPDEVVTQAMEDIDDLALDANRTDEFIEHVRKQESPKLLRMKNTVAKVLARRGDKADAKELAVENMNICQQEGSSDYWGEDAIKFISRDSWSIIRDE